MSGVEKVSGTLNAKTKITFQLHVETLNKLNYQLKELFIKRDDFLNHLIKTEAQQISEDLTGRRQSEVARKFIVSKYKELRKQFKETKDTCKEFKKVNVVVDKQVADLLNEIVRKSNLVRDSVINRIILMACAEDFLLEYLDLQAFLTGSSTYERYIAETMPTAPLMAIKRLYEDPLYYLKLAAEDRHQKSLYLLDLPDAYQAFSIYLEDWQVPHTREFKEAQKRSQQILDKLLEKQS